MPPAPICAVTSYEPRRVREGIAIRFHSTRSVESIQPRGHSQEQPETIAEPSPRKSSCRNVARYTAPTRLLFARDCSLRERASVPNAIATLIATRALTRQPQSDLESVGPSRIHRSGGATRDHQPRNGHPDKAYEGLPKPHP